MTPDDFIALYPAFAAVDPDRIQAFLDMADRRIGTGSAFGARREDALGLLTAHLLTVTDASSGGGGGPIQSVTAGSASITYGSSSGSGAGGLGATGYGREYLELVRLCGPGARVLT